MTSPKEDQQPMTTREETSVRCGAPAALTAAPGEQEPCGWQFCCPDGKWIGCDEPSANELRDEPKKFRRVYLSPPQAAGWNEAIEAAKLVVERWSLPTIQTPSMWLIDKAGIVAEIESLRREAPAPEGVTDELQWPANLHPNTLDLVKRFAVALAKKLRLAEEKYDYGDGWADGDWEAVCREHLYQHLDKGDPRDVGAYCAFMWHHGWITYRPDAGCGVRVKPLEWVERVGVTGTFDANTSIGHYIASITDDGRGHWFIVGLTTGNYTTANIEAVKAAAQADYERRILSALSTPPAAAESKASVEARLREALIALDERLRSCGSLHTAEDAYDSFYQEIVSEALSAVGDEAKKSEGGATLTFVRRLVDDPNSASGKSLQDVEVRPSDPTADRREIVTLDRQFIIDLIREKYDPVPSDWPAKDANRWDDGTGEIADAILAALDGGAGA